MYPTFDTACYKISNASSEICERTCDKTLFIWSLDSCDLKCDSVCVAHTMIFKRYVEVIKIGMTFFVGNRVTG